MSGAPNHIHHRSQARRPAKVTRAHSTQFSKNRAGGGDSRRRRNPRGHPRQGREVKRRSGRESNLKSPSGRFFSPHLPDPKDRPANNHLRGERESARHPYRGQEGKRENFEVGSWKWEVGKFVPCCDGLMRVQATGFRLFRSRYLSQPLETDHGVWGSRA